MKKIHACVVIILLAALCTYALGYRFYSKWIAAKVLALDDRRATPAVAHDDGKDFVKTNKWIVFGHHFAAISGPGPLLGPVLAAQFGYLPGTLWILIGAVLGGAVLVYVGIQPPNEKVLYISLLLIAIMAVFWYGFGVRTRFAGPPEVKGEMKAEADVVNT